ncbi:MAG: hypothetical protein J6L24_05055 [Oscillospiraceae bacterium]|nr:hypothetical protein [Oscillospiraceae bacterium]
MKYQRSFIRTLTALMAAILLLSGLSLSGFAAQKEEVMVSDIVSESVAAKGGVVSKGNADFQFLMGDFFGGGSLSPFTTFAGTGNYDPADSVGDPNGENFAFRWQWRATAKSNTILKITAKEEMMFLVEQREEIGDEQWATHSAYTYVTENPDGDRLVYREMMVKAKLEKDYIRTEIHLAKGDTLYIVYTVPAGDGGVVTAHYLPWFVMDPASYDASKRTDYSVIADLRNAKAERPMPFASYWRSWWATAAFTPIPMLPSWRRSSAAPFPASRSCPPWMR